MPRLVLPAGAHGEGCWAGGCCDGGAPRLACCSWQGLPSHDGGGWGLGGLLTAPADRWPLCIQVLLTSALQPSGHTFSISIPTTFTSCPPSPRQLPKAVTAPSQVQAALQLCTCTTHTPTCPQGAHSAHPLPPTRRASMLCRNTPT